MLFDRLFLGLVMLCDWQSDLTGYDWFGLSESRGESAVAVPLAGRRERLTLFNSPTSSKITISSLLCFLPLYTVQTRSFRLCLRHEKRA